MHLSYLHEYLFLSDTEEDLIVTYSKMIDLKQMDSVPATDKNGLMVLPALFPMEATQMTESSISIYFCRALRIRRTD